MTTTNHKDLLIKWLKGAYAMESTLIKILENQSERASAFPDLQKRLYDHHLETRRHADLVKGCVTRLGGDVSEIRAGISKLMGDAQSQFLGVFDDSIVKDALASAASEEFEIASYKAIIALADRLDDQETVQVCQEILDEEEEMLDFINGRIENLVDKAYDQGILRA